MNKRRTQKNSAKATCKNQLRIGRKVLRAKTRKQALALMKTVPRVTPAAIEQGLAWWDRVQYLDSKSIAALIKEQAPVMLAQCIEQHGHGH
jgi:hypothetical protein